MIYEPLHPGELVKETCIEGTGLSVAAAARKLGVNRTTLSRLIHGHAGISPEMATRLAMALNTSITMWMNLQRDYDVWRAEKLKGKLHVEKLHADNAHQ